MIPEAVSRRMADASDYGPLDGLTAAMPVAQVIEGATYYNAAEWMTGVSHTSDGGKAIVILCNLGGAGLMVGLTIEGARTLSSSLSILADRVEAAAAGDAAALLDAFRAKRGGCQ